MYLWFWELSSFIFCNILLTFLTFQRSFAESLHCYHFAGFVFTFLHTLQFFHHSYHFSDSFMTTSAQLVAFISSGLSHCLQRSHSQYHSRNINSLVPPEKDEEISISLAISKIHEEYSINSKSMNWKIEITRSFEMSPKIFEMTWRDGQKMAWWLATIWTMKCDAIPERNVWWTTMDGISEKEKQLRMITWIRYRSRCSFFLQLCWRFRVHLRKSAPKLSLLIFCTNKW